VKHPPRLFHFLFAFTILSLFFSYTTLASPIPKLILFQAYYIQDPGDNDDDEVVEDRQESSIHEMETQVVIYMQQLSGFFPLFKNEAHPFFVTFLHSLFSRCIFLSVMYLCIYSKAMQLPEFDEEEEEEDDDNSSSSINFVADRTIIEADETAVEDGNSTAMEVKNIKCILCISFTAQDDTSKHIWYLIYFRCSLFFFFFFFFSRYTAHAERW
jgi:hypothetical protein